MWLESKDACLTKLEVSVVGTDMIARTEQALHHQSSSHGIIHTEMLRDAAFLQKKQKTCWNDYFSSDITCLIGSDHNNMSPFVLQY